MSLSALLVFWFLTHTATAQTLITEVLQYRQNLVYQAGELVHADGQGPGDQPAPLGNHHTLTMYPLDNPILLLWASNQGDANMGSPDSTDFSLHVDGSFDGTPGRLDPAEYHSTATTLLRLNVSQTTTIKIHTHLSGHGFLGEISAIEDPNTRSESSFRFFREGTTTDLLFERTLTTPGVHVETRFISLDPGNYLFEASALAQVNTQAGAPEFGLTDFVSRGATASVFFDVVPAPATLPVALALAALSGTRRRRR